MNSSLIAHVLAFIPGRKVCDKIVVERLAGLIVPCPLLFQKYLSNSLHNSRVIETVVNNLSVGSEIIASTEFIDILLAIYSEVNAINQEYLRLSIPASNLTEICETIINICLACLIVPEREYIDATSMSKGCKSLVKFSMDSSMTQCC
jgi:hypothetical protein